VTATPIIVTPLTPTAARSEMTVPVNATDAAVRAMTAAMQRGDEAAFRQFHDAYFERLLRYLFVVARGDDEVAGEALQETFIRVARHVREFDSADTLWSWLTVIARSTATDLSRKRSRYWQLLSRYIALWTHEDEVQPAVESDLEAMLTGALRVLDAADCTLIEAKYFRGATVRALADELNISEKAVESRLTRARNHLRKELQKRLRHEI
jgi:RNA polymerase sigma-70 factor, ECF subfamily